MSTEELFKEFLKFYNTTNPAGMGASKAKEIKSGVAAGFDRNTASKSGTVEDGMWYPDYDEDVNQTLPAVYDPDAPAPDYEQEFYESGDSFADIVEKRASAPEPPDAFPARVRDGMDIMRQKSRARQEAALAGDGPAPEPPDAFPARVRDGMDIMRQKSRAREEAALADAEQDDTEAFDKLFGTVDGEVPEQDDTEAFDKLFGTVDGEVGQPAEKPTVEEMNSRNEEFGDSFDFMEGSEEYPAGRDKKSDRKAQRKAKRKSKRKDKEPLTTTEAGRTIDEIGAPERSLGDYAADAMAESAEPAPEVDYSDQAIALFKNTHGTSFDPKSSKDLGKLEKMKAILAERGGLGEMSPNQFALQVYRKYP